jgi:hypothetical protein
MIETMMTAMTALLALSYFGAFKGREIKQLKKDPSMLMAVSPPKGEVKGGIKFLPAVWEEESVEEMEVRVLNNLFKEGCKAWPKTAPMPVALPALPVKERPFSWKVPAPVRLPELT